MKIIIKYFLVFFFSTMLVGCGGGGGGDSTVNPTLPGDATRITDANASAIAATAIDSVFLASDYGSFAGFRQDGSSSSTGSVINYAIQETLKRIRPSSQTIASRTTQTQSCPDGGSITATADGTDTSGSGSISFDNCTFGTSVIDGSFSFEFSFNNTSGNYNISVDGRITASDSVFGSMTMAMNYSESGNIDGSFSTDISLSVSGTSENFLLTTTQTITGMGLNIYSGEVIVSGADGTRLKLIVIATDTVDVYFDDGSGTFIYRDTVLI